MGTRTRTWLLVTALATVVTVVAPAPAADATTTVTTKGNVVTIHVSVDVIGGKGQTGPEGQPLVEYWEQVLQDTWGSAFDRLPYKNCLKFELDLDLKARSGDAKVRAGRDALYVDPKSNGGWEGAGWEGVPETSRNPRTGDGTRSFEYDRDGTVPVNAPPTVIAHEFGHLFGLGDDRADGAPKAGRDIDTVMVGGVPGVDLTQTPRIDQNLVNRIGEQIKKHLENKGKKFPECETWAGTLNLRVGACNSELVSEGPVTLGVAPDGSVTGTGSVGYTEIGGVCAGSPLDTTKQPFGVSGTRDRDGFHLTVADQYFGATPIDLTVAGTSAEGSAQWGSSTIPVTAAMTLECKKNCEGEAVG